MNNLVDSVEFRARSPRQSLPGLEAAQAGLRAIRTELDAINGKLSGMSTMSLFKSTKGEIQSMLKEGMNISQRIPVKDVAKVLGIPDVKDFQTFVQKWKTTHKELSKNYLSGSFSNQQFRSGEKAAEITRKYFKSAETRSKDVVGQMQSLLSGGGSGGKFTGKFSAEIAGDIPLIIPASRIVATLGPGAIAVQGSASAPSGGRGRGGGGTISGGGGGAGGATGPLINRSEITLPGKQPVIRSTYLESFGKELEIAEQAGNEISRKLTTDVAAQQAEKFKQQFARIKETLQKELSLPQQQRDYGRIGALREDAASTAQGLLSGTKGKDLKAMGLGPVARQIESFASTQSSKAVADKQRGMVADAQRVFSIREELAKARERGDREEATRLNSERRQMEKRIASQNKMVASGQKSDQQKAKNQQKYFDLVQGNADNHVRMTTSHAAAERGLADFLGQGGVVTRDSSRQIVGKNGPATVRTVQAEREFGGNKQVYTARFDETGASVERLTKKMNAARAEAGYLGSDFLQNTIKVTAWAASVSVLYKSLELAQFSMHQTLEIGEQFQRLDQVFKRVGGSTQELTSDVLHLAAINGRSTEEAMQSALQWARLGMTRAQINEAVTVSMMAANDAGISASETTEKLQAVMQTYNLNVGQLRGTLSEIVQITNSYNVSTGDMLDGLSRTAAAAKQAGLPLAELMGMLGATVGSTGQSGANIGNAIKSITLALSNPVLQQKLRSEYRFEATTGGEDIKNMSVLLSDLYVKYQHLNDAQRQSLLFSVAGRTQANRLEAMLDNYVKAQTLAINAQLNLNTAEEENKKIKAALATQLRGLSGEWERFVVIQANHGPVQAMTQMSTALRNLLTIANSGKGILATGILGLLLAGGAKTILTGMTLKGSTGFAGRTGERVRGAMGALNNSMIDVFTNYIGGSIATHVGTRRPYVASRTGGPVMNVSVGEKAAARMLMITGRWQMSNNLLTRSIGNVTRALGVGLIALRQWALPMIAAELATIAFNRAMEAVGASSESAEKRLAGVAEKAEKATAAANAYAEAADALRTIEEALKPQTGFSGIRPEDAKRMLSQSAELMFQDEPDLGKREKLTAEMRKQLETLRQQGNMQQIQNILEARRNEYLDKRKDKLQEQYEALKETEQKTNEEISRLKAVDHSAFFFIGREARQNKIQELEKRQAETSSEKTRNQMDQNDAYDERLQYDVKHQSSLEKHKLTMQSIAEIFNSIATANPYDKALVRVASLKAQLGSIQTRREELTKEDNADLASDSERNGALAGLDTEEKGARESLMKANQKWKKIYAMRNSAGGKIAEVISGVATGEGAGDTTLDIVAEEEHKLKTKLAQIGQRREKIVSGRTDEEGFASRQKQRAALDDEERNLKAQLAANEQSLPTFEKQMRFQFGQEQGRRDMTQFNYGIDDTDKLQRQAEGARRELKQYDNKPNLSIQERGRQLELETEYYHTIIGLRERAAGIERDINQLVYDRTREMQRSLFEAGPNDLLRKLAAFRTAFDKKGNLRDVSAGQMMSMSPDFRHEVAGAQFVGLAAGKTMSGNVFDPQLTELLNERNRARNYSGNSPEWSNGQLDQLQKDISQKLGDIAGSLAKEIPPLFAEASTALDSFTDKVNDRVIPALEAFAEKLDVISGTKSGSRPHGQFGGAGGAAGNNSKAAL